jgi:hypothetical protein
MSRKARVDSPGALHHIMVYGIDRRRIFSDDQGRNNFTERPGNSLPRGNPFFRIGPGGAWQCHIADHQ